LDRTQEGRRGISVSRAIPLLIVIPGFIDAERLSIDGTPVAGTS
jgi:hypothetical protein